MKPARRAVLVLFGLIVSAVTGGCTSLGLAVANGSALFGSYHRVTGLPYGSDPRERLDMYVPSAKGPHPVVVFWYGGSWQAGRRSQYRFVGAALAEKGIVTIIPDYRLYPPIKFPELMDDGAGAVAWVQQHVSEFGGDPHRIILMGHSAGGHMAALLALDPQYLERAGVDRRNIIGLVGLSGPYALDPNTDALRTIFAAPYTPADWRPVQFASKDAPRTLLLHGLADTVVYPSHAEKLKDALESHGASVESHFYPGRGHADTIASFTTIARHRTPAFDQVIEFIMRLSAH